jgi:hypothetical protein
VASEEREITVATLEAIRRRRRRLEDQEAAIVGQLRQQGTSWHQIGVALGITAEGARKKFADRS